MNIIAVIPAREGSKKIKNKNILKINQKPLIYYSIKVSKKITKIRDTYVSTDSEKIKRISISYGAKVPFLRPKKISKDRSTDLEFMKHFCIWYKKKNKIPIDLLIHLRPTTPFRNPKTINKAINLMIKNKNYSSLRSFIVSDFSGYKLWLKKNKQAKILVKTKKNYHSIGRQFIPKTYSHIGYVDILRPKLNIEKNTIIGKKVLFFEINKNKEYNIDIDTEEDLKQTNEWVKKYSYKI